MTPTGRLRAALAEGRRLRGLFIKLADIAVVDLAAATQDFVVLDLEHSTMSERAAMLCAAHAAAVGLPALVRVPSVDPGQVGRLLEAGAAGIQLSTVTEPDEVDALRDAMHYPPAGRRSISLGHAAAGYGSLGLAGYLEQQSATPPLLVAQIETELAPEVLAAILDAGPDVAFLGTTDLLVALGLSPERLRATALAYADAIRDAGVSLGGFGLDLHGVSYDVHATDVQLLADALHLRARGS